MSGWRVPSTVHASTISTILIPDLGASVTCLMRRGAGTCVKYTLYIGSLDYGGTLDACTYCVPGIYASRLTECSCNALRCVVLAHPTRPDPT